LSIAAPAEAVFPYLTQPERLKSWIDGLSEVSEFRPTPKVDGIASGRVKKTQRIISNADGSQVHYQDQVIRYDQNLSISVQSSNQQQVLTYIYQLEPRDGETRLTYRIKKNSCGVGRFLAPISSSDLQERIDSDIRKLKKLVESSPHPVIAPTPSESNALSPDPIDPAGGGDPTPDVSPPDVSTMPVPGSASDITRRFREKYQEDAKQSETTQSETTQPETTLPVTPVSDGSVKKAPYGSIAPPPIKSNGPDAETPVSGQPFTL